MQYQTLKYLSVAFTFAALGCSAGDINSDYGVRHYDDAVVTTTYADGNTRLELTDLDGNSGAVLEYTDGAEGGELTFAGYSNEIMYVAISDEIDADWLYAKWSDGGRVRTFSRTTLSFTNARLQLQHTGQCLASNGDSVSLAGCNGANTQQWTTVYYYVCPVDPYEPCYQYTDHPMLRNAAQGKCLDGRSLHGAIVLKSCNFGVDRQWKIFNSGYSLFQDWQKYLCMEATNVDQGDNRVFSKNCDGGNPRQYFQPI